MVNVAISTSGSGQMQSPPMNELVKLQMGAVGFKVTLTTMDWNALLSGSRGGGDKSPECHGVNISRGLAGPFSGLIRHIWTRQWAPNLRGFKQAQSWYPDLTPITVAP